MTAKKLQCNFALLKGKCQSSLGLQGAVAVCHALFQMLGSLEPKAAEYDNLPHCCFRWLGPKYAVLLYCCCTLVKSKGDVLNAGTVKFPKCLKVWARFRDYLVSFCNWFISTLQCPVLLIVLGFTWSISRSAAISLSLTPILIIYLVILTQTWL